MYVNKADIVAILRSRGLAARADWVDQTLPAAVDTNRNRGLLRTLDIDPAELTPVEVTAQPV